MIKVGILGTGFGSYHAELYKKIEGFEVVAIFGRNPEKLEDIGDRLEVKTTMNIDDIIEDPNIDVVDICLPTELHAQWAIKALKKNKHVFCETPLAYKLEEAEEIKKISEDYNKNVYVDLFFKFSSAHNITLNKIKNKELGEVVSFRSYNKTAPTWGHLGIDKNISDFHIHNFDFLMEVIGFPQEVYSNGIDMGDKSIVTSALKYKDKIALIESFTNLPENSPFNIGFEIVCEKGTIKFDAEYGVKTKEDFAIVYNNGIKEVLVPEMTDDYEEVIKHIKYCLENNRKSDLLDINSAIEVMKIKNGILRSLQLKEFVKIL